MPQKPIQHEGEGSTGSLLSTGLSVDRDIPTSQVVKGFMEQENVMFNAAEALTFGRSFPEDPEYNVFEDLSGYEGFSSELSNVKSREEMVYRKQKIDEEQEVRSDFASADGFQKALSIGAFIVTDPTAMIPLGGAVHNTYRVSGRILEGATKTAGIAMGVETGREAVLQYNQDTRTTNESLVNITAASVIGGLLGGAAGGLSKSNIDDIVSRYNDEMVTPELNMQTGVDSVGAMRVGTTFEQEEIKGLNKTKKVFSKIPGFLKNPTWEGATSGNKAVRDLTEKLSDLSLVKNKNTQGIASEQSVELAVKMYDTLRVPFYKDYNEAWKTYNTRVKALGEKSMSRGEFDEGIGKAMRRKDVSDVPEIQQAAQSARRNVFDPVLKRAEEVGIFKNVDEIDIKTADSWMKRVYDINKIQANRPEFKRRVLTWLKKERELAEAGSTRAGRMDVELDTLSEEVIDRITNVTQGRIPYDVPTSPASTKTPKARGSAKQRVFAIPDEDIEDFLVSDINSIMENHLRTMAPDNELMAKFETLDFDEIKGPIQENINGRRNTIENDKSLSPEQKAKRMLVLDKEFKRDIQNSKAMWDKLRGLYAQPDDYSAPAHVFERGAMALNFVTKLGDMVASSLADVARPVMIHGVNRSYGDLFRSAITDMQGIKMAKSEIQELGTALDLTNSITALKRNNMDEFMPTTGKIDAVGQKVSTGFATATGINHWNAIGKTFSGIVTQNRMLKAIDDLGKGKTIPTLEMENLSSHGIGKNEAKIISAEFAKHGETRRVLRIANARNWENSRARGLFQSAVRKQVDETITTPGLDKPLWLSKPGWRTVGQFKSFSFVSTQRTTLAGIQQADASVAQGVLSAIMLGSLVYAWKGKMAGRDLSDDPRIWIAEGVDRSGIAGWAFDLNNIVEKATRGTVGVNALMGGPPMSRYAQRNVTGALLGPSFGMAQTIFGLTGSVASGEFTQSDTHAARRLLPGQNIPYLRGIFDAIEAGSNSALNINE